MDVTTVSGPPGTKGLHDSSMRTNALATGGQLAQSRSEW